MKLIHVWRLLEILVVNVGFFWCLESVSSCFNKHSFFGERYISGLFFFILIGLYILAIKFIFQRWFKKDRKTENISN